MLSRGLPPLGAAGIVTAVVCNATAVIETSHDILIKSSNVGLFRLSSTALCQRTDRHVENKSREGRFGGLARYHWIVAPRPKVSIQSLAKFANFFKRILRGEICKFRLNLDVMKQFYKNMLFLSRKNFNFPIFLRLPAISSEYTTFFKRCQIKKGYTYSIMPFLDIYSIPHFPKKSNFFCNVLFSKKNRWASQAIPRQKAPSVGRMHRWHFAPLNVRDASRLQRLRQVRRAKKGWPRC